MTQRMVMGLSLGAVPALAKEVSQLLPTISGCTSVWLLMAQI